MGARAVWCVCVLCVLGLLVWEAGSMPGEALGQDAAEAEDAKVWPSPPEDVSIKLALVDPKASYQQGERIEVKLSFSTTRPGAYTVDLATYDRSGRLPSETFLLEPAADVVDPLAVYFESGGGMMGGGLRQIPVMEKETLEVTRTLNEHVRFLKPGRYTLRVVTDRVGNDHGPGLGPLLAADSVSFDVVATDPAWAAQTLKQALGVLDDPKADDDAKGEAAAVIQHLGTDAAVEVMAVMLTRDHQATLFPFMFGLMGAPNRALVVEALSRVLVAPDAAVDGMFFHTLTLLDAAQVAPLPGPYPVEFSSDQSHPKVVAWMARDKTFREAKEAATKARVTQLDAALAKKTPAAAAVCVQALSELGWQRASGAPAADLEDARLIEHFIKLPVADQMHLLAYRWVRLRGEGIVPTLNALLASPDTSDDLYSLALSRLATLKPEEARALLVAQIASPKPRFSPFGIERVLSAIPAADMPNVDASLALLLADGLTKSFDQGEVAAALVEQYASAALAPQVQAALDRGEGGWSPSVEASLLTYLLRVNEADAIKRIIPWATTYAYEVERIAKRRWTPALEAALTKLLETSTIPTAANLVRVLGNHGSPAIQAVLMDHLTRFHADWSTRPATLNDPKSEDASHARTLEEALWRSLSHAQHWVLDPKTSAEVIALCTSDQAKDQVRFIRWFDAPEISIWLWLSEETGELSGRVAHFDTRNITDAISKLNQFPVPTRFKIEIGGAPPSLTTTAQEKLSAAILAAGHTL